MKENMKRLSDKLKLVFGYGIMITLFVGGLTFFGYVAAIIIGGDTAAMICTVIYKQIVPIMIYATTILVLLGLVCMYLAGEFALTPDKKNKKSNEEHIIEDKTSATSEK